MSASAEVLSAEAILDLVRDVLVSSFELDRAKIVLDADLFDDLDLDSIDAIDLLVGLEEQSGISLNEDELRHLRRIQDVVHLLQAKLPGR